MNRHAVQSPFLIAPDDGAGTVSMDDDVVEMARTDACVLLTGSGEATEALARRIHALSAWRHGPFVVVDCGWPEAVLDSLLFGSLPIRHGPTLPLKPYPTLAASGTMLIREVGRLSRPLQSRLAECLTELRSMPRRGRARRRLMASSSQWLFRRVVDGTFDDRLFYRLNVMHVILSGAEST